MRKWELASELKENTDNTIWNPTTNSLLGAGVAFFFQLKGFFEATTEPQNILLELTKQRTNARNWFKRPEKP